VPLLSPASDLTHILVINFVPLRQMNCGTCSSFVQKCDLASMFITKDSGCRPVCTVNVWQPRCCHGYYGRDCLVCPGGVHSPCSNHGKCDDGHFGNGTCTCDAGFGGVACELCAEGFYGPTCKACNCSGHGSCDDGRKGTGVCFCQAGWSGERCNCSADGPSIWNGGCAKGAKCSQKGEKVSCTCPKSHTGDGFTCQPIDPCAAGDNGGCHEHATCTMTAPGKKKCTCKDNYIGDGVTCELKQLPISRCLQDNGWCHQDATCTDLHFEDATLGVFHYRSSRGQYKLNYTAAQQACASEGGSLASFTQLSYAQQAGMNLCAAGWLDQARVAYPTTYSNPNCGFGHVGIVDYGTRKNLSETWDTFCYRMKEVQCKCKPGYVGDGFGCTGNLLQVLTSTPTFSNFLTQILNYSQVSDSGKQFVKRLSNLTVQATLFVPDNSGFPGNQTLSHRDLEFHLSEGQALTVDRLKNGSRIRTRVGSLTVLGVADLLDPSSSRYVNNRFITNSDILASNGIIHVLQGPLEAPPPRQEMHAAHKAGMGVGVVLLVVLVAAVVFVGYHFYRHKAKPFQFHYFKEDAEEEAPAANGSRSICNPVYEASPDEAESDTSAAAVS
uniref:Stabilin 2 n=1 Tax=Stegastes partitus TaxID=144197 RepID=A0A3B5ARW8_9TELE